MIILAVESNISPRQLDLVVYTAKSSCPGKILLSIAKMIIVETRTII